MKQDTSWDVGVASAETFPAAAAAPTKTDSMQWQAPNSGRNDGTDLWKSTLSGVPQQPKPQVTTPWGNHTPTNPADYKNWGENPEEGGVSAGGPSDDNGMWNPRDNPMQAPSQNQPWEDRNPMGQPRFAERDQRPDWGGKCHTHSPALSYITYITFQGLPSLRTTQCGDLEAPANGEVLTWGPEAVVEQSPTTGAPRPRVNPEARAIGEPEMGVQCKEGPPGTVTAPQCLAEHTTSPMTWEPISGALAKVETGAQLHQVVSKINLFLSIFVS